MGALEATSAVITGAGGALGGAIAERYAREGARALGLIDVDESALGPIRSRLDPFDCDIRVAAVDVTDEDAMTAFVAEAAEAFDGLDVMVNNAGILGANARLQNVEVADIRRVLDVNTVGVFVGMKAALHVMRPVGRGVIINTASVAGLTAWAYAGAYGASKAAVVQLTKVAAVEYARDGVRVNCVCPGTFPTAIHAELPPEALEKMAQRHPLGRLGTPEEVAGAYVYLAGSDATWTTGSAVVVDGGYSAP